MDNIKCDPYITPTWDVVTKGVNDVIAELRTLKPGLILTPYMYYAEEHMCNASQQRVNEDIVDDYVELYISLPSILFAKGERTDGLLIPYNLS